MKKDKLKESWIKLQTVEQDSDESEKLTEASNQLNMMAMKTPRECWEICMEILEETDDEWILTNLAAGPIENLLAIHPDDTIQMIEQEAKVNSKLKKVLANVWQNLMPDDVWDRLKQV